MNISLIEEFKNYILNYFSITISFNFELKKLFIPSLYYNGFLYINSYKKSSLLF